VSFDKHSSLIERTQRSAWAFKLGLLGGIGVHFTPPRSKRIPKLRAELLVTIVQ
jgi:hypothetical protein